MNSRKFLFGGIFVLAVFAMIVFLVRCTFVNIESDPDPKLTEELTSITTDISTADTTTDTTSVTTDVTTIDITEVSTSITVFETTTSTAVNHQATTANHVANTQTDCVTTICETSYVETMSVTTTNTDNDAVDLSTYEFVKTFKKGTYYPDYVNNGLMGGSGRSLIDCATGDGEIKGSVACKYIYDRYKYEYSGGRTKVYLRLPKYPQMDGFYYVDDCCAFDDVIDFYWRKPCQCPFYDPIGIATDIDCWVVSE